MRERWREAAIGILLASAAPCAGDDALPDLSVPFAESGRDLLRADRAYHLDQMPLGAFYSAQRGFRCALVWPVERFTLRLEGGEDSEFGYYGIAGVQWLHPRLPIAVGAGIPMNLRDGDGDVGVIVQFRMRLD